MGAQRLDVAGAVVGLAERVEQQRHLAQAEPAVELPAERDHLDVEVRVVGAEHLDADLVELAVAAALRLLVPELRPGVPDLPRRRRPVLHERPAHAGGQLGPQRDVTAALVDEVVHLLRHHVGGVADALEHAEVLEQRRDHLPVAGRLDDVARRRRRTAASEPISGGRMSRIPGLVWNSGTAREPTGGPLRRSGDSLRSPLGSCTPARVMRARRTRRRGGPSDQWSSSAGATAGTSG